MNNYLEKWGLTTNGIKDEGVPDRRDFFYIFCSGIFSFLGIFLVILIEHHTDFLLIVASFGASAVLLYDCIDSPLAQPRNAIGGHIISSLVGVSIYKLFMIDEKYFYTPLVGGLSVGLSIIAMGLTKTTHPPGAASSLIAVIGPQRILDKGYMYVIHPIASGISIMVIVALVTNNIINSRVYPKYWV